MMLRPIYCDNCGKSGSFPFRINWEYDDSRCDKCSQYKGKYLEYNLCSSKCMKEWVLKFVGHKHIWKEHPVMLGAYGEKGKEKIMKRCNVCNLDKEFKASKKDIRESQKTIKEILEQQNADK